LKNKTVRFLLFGGGFYLLWLLLYYFVVKSHTNWDYQLNYNIVEVSQWILQIFGIETFIDIESDHVIIVLNEGNFRPILVGDECNGFKLFSIFSIFVLAFPGNWRVKLWFIPLGILIVHLANIIRVSALLMINNHYPKYLDFNHLYTFTIFVYAIIFALWYWYAKRYSSHVKEY
jgi:exosortase/archaeosortase family protein